MLHFINEEIHELPENEKRVIEHPPFSLAIIFQFFYILPRKTPYYHGNPRLLRESILLPDSTIFSPIAPLSAASKNPKIGAHHPP